MNAIKSKEEIRKLKHNWECDPCWDIEDTEGFEEYKDELRAFRLKKEKEWEDQWRKKMQTKAKKMGIPGNLKLANYIDGLEYKISKLQDEIAEMGEHIH